MLGAPPTDILTPALAATGIVGLFGASATVLFRSFRRDDQLARLQTAALEAQSERLNRQDRAIDRLKDDVADCERRNSILLAALQRAGITIPEEAWRRRRATDVLAVDDIIEEAPHDP